MNSLTVSHFFAPLAALPLAAALMPAAAFAQDIREELTYFPDGAVASRAQMRDGKAHGLHTDYYPNGEVHSTMTLADGVPVGEARLLHPNGQLQSRLQYGDRGVLLSTERFTEQGVRILERRWDQQMREQGTSRSWYDSGKPQQVVEFFNGRREGWSRRWHEDGSLASECQYIAGKAQGACGQEH